MEQLENYNKVPFQQHEVFSIRLSKNISLLYFNINTNQSKLTCSIKNVTW